MLLVKMMGKVFDWWATTSFAICFADPPYKGKYIIWNLEHFHILVGWYAVHLDLQSKVDVVWGALESQKYGRFLLFFYFLRLKIICKAPQMVKTKKSAQKEPESSK